MGETGAMTAYDAFISYSHVKDRPMAAALQAAVQRLGKPWYRRRSLRVFRDDSSLSATPELWPSIERALENSRYLILLASRDAATSAWVDKEVAYWIAHKSVNTILIGLTEGSLRWDSSAGDFAWGPGTPLPPALKRQFRTEPRWVDLSAYRDGVDQRSAGLIELSADFAAAIQGTPKDDLLSKEVREQRRALELALSAAGSLLILTGLAGWQWHTAIQQRDRAEKTLAAATGAASNLVFEVAVKFRHQVGIPVDLVREVLARARDLQRELAKAGGNSPEVRRVEAVALRELATTYLAQGDFVAALEAAERSREIMNGLLTKEPNSVQSQRELSLSYNRIGEALLRLDRRPEAIDAFQAALQLRERLASANLENSEAQRDLAVSFERIADVRFLSEEFEQALDLYRKALLIREKLALTLPENEEWLRDLSVNYEKVGDVLYRTGEFEKALTAYRKSFDIRRLLTAAKPANSEWQRDLSVSYAKIGDGLFAMGQSTEAIEHYRKSLAIRDKLATNDPHNAQWQSDLIVCLVKLAQAGDEPRARLILAREIARRLALQGKLGVDQVNWITAIEDWLAQLPK